MQFTKTAVSVVAGTSFSAIHWPAETVTVSLAEESAVAVIAAVTVASTLEAVRVLTESQAPEISVTAIPAELEEWGSADARQEILPNVEAEAIGVRTLFSVVLTRPPGAM